MSKRDVQILISSCIRFGVRIRHECIESCVDPREANSTRDRVTIASIVEVLNVVSVFEAKPFVWGKDIEITERG